jgi:hypothetical protein
MISFKGAYFPKDIILYAVFFYTLSDKEPQNSTDFKGFERGWLEI